MSKLLPVIPILLLALVIFFALRPSDLPGEIEAMNQAMDWLEESGVDGEVAAIASPGSMGSLPTRQHWMVIEHVKAADIYASRADGDIVLFLMRGSRTVHRAVGRDGDRLTTKGDANKHPDPIKIRDSDLIGRLVHVVEWR